MNYKLKRDGSSWNSKAWTEMYEKIVCDKDFDRLHDLRISVYDNTVALVMAGEYTTEDGTVVHFHDEGDLIKNTVFYSDAFSVADTPALDVKTHVTVGEIDCLKAAENLKASGYNVAVLNMANRQNPGGGVVNGCGAQEEGLFRRTNLFCSMYQFAWYASKYGLEKSPNQYPLDRNFGGVYSPNATVFRDGASNGYALLDNPFQMSFIAVAAMNRPDLDENMMIVDNLIDPIKNKIRTIFRIGLQHRHDALVLGAWGCGAFVNPPKHIARLFHEVMQEDEFCDKFKVIYFAIINDHNSHRRHNQEGNLIPFQREFNAGSSEIWSDIGI